MASANINGDDETRLLELCKDETRTPTAMIKRLIFLAHKALRKREIENKKGCE